MTRKCWSSSDTCAPKSFNFFGGSWFRQDTSLIRRNPSAKSQDRRHDQRSSSVPARPLTPKYTMSAPGRVLRRCIYTAKSVGSVRPSIGGAQQRLQRRWASSEATAAPTNPKIATIVDQISQLTLLETADLVSTLKVRRPHARDAGNSETVA